MYERKFSRWCRWADRTDLAGIQYPGVYAVVHTQSNIAGRVFSWRQDIIYIGMTNASYGLRGRLKQFDDTIHGRLAHGGADRVRFKYPGYAHLVPLLFVAIAPFKFNTQTPSPADFRVMGTVARLEYLCFAEYAERYKSKPQFNQAASPKYSQSRKPR